MVEITSIKMVDKDISSKLEVWLRKQLTKRYGYLKDDELVAKSKEEGLFLEHSTEFKLEGRMLRYYYSLKKRSGIEIAKCVFEFNYNLDKEW